jgi:peptidyl-prolyl cis-trans isomerase C
MQHRHSVAIGFAAFACLVGCGKGSQPDAAETAAKDAVAVVNGHPLSKATFEAYTALLQQQAHREFTPEQRQQALDQLINMELLTEAAEKSGLPKDAQVTEQLTLMRMNVLGQAMAEKYVKDHPVKDEELRPAYDAQVATLPQEYHVRHILVEDKATADKVIQQLKGGADFGKLAAEKSKDPSKSSGGDIGWFSVGAMDKSYSAAVMALKKGQYSSEPVQTQYGWHVFLLEDTRATQAPAFDDVKEQVRTFLQNKRAQTYLEDLKKAAKIEKKEPVAAAEKK